MTRKRAGIEPVCGRLGQDKAYGVTDFCDKPAGHVDEHVGKYHGMVWRDHQSGRRSGEQRIVRGVSPVHNIPPGGNIRGN